MMEPEIRNLTVSDPRVAAELLLASHVAGTLLANAIPDDVQVGEPERKAILTAIGTILGGDLLDLRMALVRQHPQFGSEDLREFKESLRAAGAGDRELWEWFDA